jgi:glycosyltransferase involved in cell wall biosynthesis
MKIALYCRGWITHEGYSGMELYAHKTAKLLAKNGHEVHCFTTIVNEGDGYNKTEDKEYNLTTHYVPGRPRHYSTEYFDNALKVLKDINGFDLVYSHSSAGRRHLKPENYIPMVANWHGIKTFRDSDNYKKIGLGLNEKSFDKDILNYKQHVIVGPNDGVSIMENGGDPESISTIYYGSDNFHIEDASEVKSKLNIADTKLVIGMAGRLSDSTKGVIQILKALDQLQFKYDFKLLVLSRKFSRDYLENRNYIELVGVEEGGMRKHYNAIDLFVNTSVRHEGFDLVNAEAALCGLPMLIGNVGLNRTALPHADTFEIGNIEDLKGNIIKNYYRLQDHKEPLRNQMRTDALTKFTEQKMAESLERVVQKTLRMG